MAATRFSKKPTEYLKSTLEGKPAATRITGKYGIQTP
jgi:hypothetical protein